MTLGWTQAADGVPVTGFNTHVDGLDTNVGLPAMNPFCACPTVTLPLALGPHYASVNAYNVVGFGPRTAVMLFNVIAPDPNNPPGRPTNFLIIRDVPPPPTPIWMSINLGDQAGSSSVANAIWTLASSGRTTWGTVDSAHYVYHPETGDGQISLKVETVTGGGLNARAGLMWRESTDVTARSVSLEVLATGQVFFMYRGVVARVAARGAPVASGSVPIWLRLIRTDPVISAAYSLDPVALGWTDLGPTQANFAPTALVGLDVTGASLDQPTVATFSNLAEQ